jgi:hypothetical protein
LFTCATALVGDGVLLPNLNLKNLDSPCAVPVGVVVDARGGGDWGDGACTTIRAPCSSMDPLPPDVTDDVEYETLFAGGLRLAVESLRFHPTSRVCALCLSASSSISVLAIASVRFDCVNVNDVWSSVS